MRFTRLLSSAKDTNKKSFTDYLLWMVSDKDFTLRGFKERIRNSQFEVVKEINKFFVADFNKLGPELHAATYTVKLGGRCRLHGSPRWIGQDESTKTNVLPKEKNINISVEGLDLSKTIIQFEGLRNIESCTNLKTLILSDCHFVDDWFISKVVNDYSHSLENLDLSNCQNVTDDGILKIGYLKKLKNLKIKNLQNAQNKEYISILLEDYIDGLVVEGTDHLSPETFEKVNNLLIKEESDFKQKFEKNAEAIKVDSSN